MRKPSLLNKIYHGVKMHPTYYREEPDRIRLVRGDFKLSNSLAGVAYCVVSEHDLNDHELWVDGELVAYGRLEIFLWVLENAPATLNAAIIVLMEHENGLAHAS